MKEISNSEKKILFTLNTFDDFLQQYGYCSPCFIEHKTREGEVIKYPWKSKHKTIIITVILSVTKPQIIINTIPKRNIIIEIIFLFIDVFKNETNILNKYDFNLIDIYERTIPKYTIEKEINSDNYEKIIYSYIKFIEDNLIPVIEGKVMIDEYLTKDNYYIFDKKNNNIKNGLHIENLLKPQNKTKPFAHIDEWLKNEFVISVINTYYPFFNYSRRCSPDFTIIKDTQYNKICIRFSRFLFEQPVITIDIICDNMYFDIVFRRSKTLKIFFSEFKLSNIKNELIGKYEFSLNEVILLTNAKPITNKITIENFEQVITEYRDYIKNNLFPIIERKMWIDDFLIDKI